MLYAEEKERLDFVYTIYHWWQAIAIFIVYLWSHLPMRVRYLCLRKHSPVGLTCPPFPAPLSPQAKLSILLATLLLACYCYWLMERRLAVKVPYRLPRIPRPRHKVKPLAACLERLPESGQNQFTRFMLPFNEHIASRNFTATL